MAQTVIGTGQGITKDSVVGDRLMNRYAIFNGLELPRRVDASGNYQLLGVGAPTTAPTVADSGAGNIAANTYAWVYVYASASHTRPVAVLDGSANYTRGNPSDTVSLAVGGNRKVDVTTQGIDQDGITHILLYRSLGAATAAIAEAGPFYYAAQAANVVGAVVIEDNVADPITDNGVAAETDNFPPNAYRYAAQANSYIFVGGNFPIGTGYRCTVTSGSSSVVVTSDIFYDGIKGWRFRILSDTTGGVDGAGLYFADYVDTNTLKLVDASGVETTYDGTASGDQNEFMVYLPGNVLRWCKKGEPEAWPIFNLVNFEGDITGIARLPNQPLILVCTDEPGMHVLDLRLVGTQSFKTNINNISTERTTSSHYSLVPVEGRLRGIDMGRRLIFETDGTIVRDISSPFIPKIFARLSNDINQHKLWHCAYDTSQHLFGAFVTFDNSQRIVDFCLGQNVLTGNWFFHWEKDLLSSAPYLHPVTGERIVLGGTEGPGGGIGGVWGRIWSPDVYSEWIPADTPLQGTIAEVVSDNEIRVTTSDGTDLADNLAGRWVLVADANGEYAQVGYITSNTANTILCDRVINGLDASKFSPSPVVGGKFYLGLIECRWGPKLLDMGDPDVEKKVLEVWQTVSEHDESAPPFLRLYRGFEQGYAEQLTLDEKRYLDQTHQQSLLNKTKGKLGPIPRWGIAFYDRSYGPTTLHSLTIVFQPYQELAT